MLSYIWPIGMIIVSNIVYQLCAKSMPDTVHPLAALTVTYAVSAVVSLLLYFLLNRGGHLLQEYAKINWVPIALGVSIIGLEAGYIYAFQAGWPVSTTQIVQAAVVAVALLCIGFWAYHEALSWKKIVGIITCLIGLVFINL